MKSKPIKSAIISLFMLLLLVSSGACASSQVEGNKQLAAAQAITPLTETPTPTQASTSPVAQALALGTKQTGNLTVTLSSNPNPPIRGTDTIEAFVTDAKGQPISDANVSYDIDMTNMSHGKNVTTASSLGGGRYSAKINFFMPGPWRVIVSIERGGHTETVRFDFNVNWK